MLETVKRILQGQKIDLVVVDGDKEITKIEYIKGAEKLPNSALNLFDLLGYEFHSDTVELFSEKKYLGRGFVCDASGVSVNIDRVPLKKSKPEDPDLPVPAPGELSISGVAEEGAKKPKWEWGSSIYTPCVILEGSPKVTKLRFSRLREIDGAIIDDKNRVRYSIEPGTRIEIKMPDGKIGPGYVCDPLGFTVKIRRNIQIKIRPKVVIDGKEVEGPEVLTEVKFSGLMGKMAAGDRLPRLLSGMPGREGLLQMAVAGLVGLFLGMMLL